MFSKLMDKALDHPVISFTSVAAVMIGTVVGLAIVDENQWQAFAKEHQCKVVGKIAGYSTYGYHNGKYQTFYVPSKTTYRCNDGIDYTR